MKIFNKRRRNAEADKRATLLAEQYVLAVTSELLQNKPLSIAERFLGKYKITSISHWGLCHTSDGWEW